MNRKLFLWEISGFFFICIAGASLHFAFELTNYESLFVAFFAAVNESTWEHLKLAFWPGVFFMLVEYPFVKDIAGNYFVAKTVGLFLMPLVIAVVWYGYTAFTRRSIFPVDLTLFFVAVLAGQAAGYRLMRAKPLKPVIRYSAIGGFAVLLLAFSVLTYRPPRMFLFEHSDLKDTQEYGILDDYDEHRLFTKAE